MHISTFLFINFIVLNLSLIIIYLDFIINKIRSLLHWTYNAAVIDTFEGLQVIHQMIKQDAELK